MSSENFLRSTIIQDILSEIQKNSSNNSKPLNVIECNSGFGMIASDNGSICPHCNAVLKNRTTLNIHLKRCSFTKKLNN